MTLLPINCNLIKWCFWCTTIYVCLRLYTAHEHTVQNGFRFETSVRVTVFAIAQHFKAVEWDWQEKIVKSSSPINTKLNVLNGNFIDKSAGNLFSRCFSQSCCSDCRNNIINSLRCAIDWLIWYSCFETTKVHFHVHCLRSTRSTSTTPFYRGLKQNSNNHKKAVFVHARRFLLSTKTQH